MAANLRRRARDHRLVYITLLHTTARNGFLHRDDDHVADTRRLALRAAQHLDALHAAGTRVVGDVELRLHLDHRTNPFLSPKPPARRRPLPKTWSWKPDGTRECAPGRRRGRHCLDRKSTRLNSSH